MKETKQAKENVEELNKIRNDKYKNYLISRKDDLEIIKYGIYSHKQTCERWLEFLENCDESKVSILYTPRLMFDKEVDLKQAIKLYDEAGI